MYGEGGQAEITRWLAAGNGQRTGTGTYYHTFGASLKAIYAEIIAKRIEIHVWRGRMGKNSKIDWPLAPANEKMAGHRHRKRHRHILT